MTVKTVNEFDKQYSVVKTKYGDMPGSPLIKRLYFEEFENQIDAENHAIRLLQQKLINEKSKIFEIESLINSKLVQKLKGNSIK
jgi:hypothetical protein